MASEIKSDKLSPSTGTALQIGDASDTITIPTGATFTITDGLGVAAGGTGLSSFTAGDVLYATGTTTLAKLAKGTAEQILSMNSGATAPEWTTAAATAGGTGQTGFTAGDLLYANSTTTLTKLGKGTGLQGLQTNSGATAPEWSNSPQSLMTAAGDVLYASGANTLAKLAKGSDDDVLTLASGVPSWAAPAGGGKVGQILQAYLITTVSIAVINTWADIAGLSVDITPAATSSKILVTGYIYGGMAGSGSTMTFRLMRDSTVIGMPADVGTRPVGYGGHQNRAGRTLNCDKVDFIDSPATTSATTYKIQSNIEYSGSTTNYINRTGDDANVIGYDPRVCSAITVTEILA
jgi:hypothetical protein